MKKVITLLFITTFLLLGIVNMVWASNTLMSSDSPTYRADQKRTGFYPFKTNIEKPQIKWKFDAGDGIESSPAIDKNGTIYFGTFSDNFFALNPDGTVKWKFEREGDQFRSSPTLAEDGTIYVIATEISESIFNPTLDKEDDFGTPKLYAMNSDGTLKWEFTAGGLTSGILYSPAIADDGSIYLISGSSDKPGAEGGYRFWAVNPDGTEKWQYYTGCEMFSGPAIADDQTVYFGCTDGNLYALTPDGEEKWAFNTGPNAIQRDSIFDAVPSIGHDGTIYCGSHDKNLYAITPKGIEKWRFTMQEKVEATPSIDSDGTLYTGSYSPGDDPYLYAISPEGEELWRFETGMGVYGSPAIDSEGILYFGSYDGYLYAVNSSDGKKIWKLKTGGGIVTSPVIDSDGTLYVGSWDNHMYAIVNKGTISERMTKGVTEVVSFMQDLSKNNKPLLILGVLMTTGIIAGGVLLYKKFRK